jgi:phenylalanyl-tRNA synthetase beta chain
MKFSLQWIRDYIELPQSLTMEQLAYDLTMRTVEVEGIENLAERLEKVVAGRILRIEPHPQADKLRVCHVDVAQAEPAVIVCGGSNLQVGQLVAVALPGAYVRWHGEGEPVEIRETTLRGVKSGGMICAAAEIGMEALFPAGDDHEILDLGALSPTPGQSLAAALQMDDQILEIDNKSLTNRPDLWGHYGIARELAAIYQVALKPLPPFRLPEQTASYPVYIDQPDLCNRYMAVVYSGLKNEPAPYWLQLRIWKVGMRPINNLVDVTNYVMLTTGQPTHGFDKAHVAGEIRVRTARAGEKLEMLDGKRLSLAETDLLICDAEKPMSLAGIMGGRADSILPDTTEMILELAKFNPTAIRHSMQRHAMRTEAGIRNEKGIDALRMDQATGLADWLIRQILPQAQITAYADCHPFKAAYPRIDVPLAFLNTRLGRELAVDEVISYLNPLGFTVDRQEVDSTGKPVLTVQVPSWRGTGDVSLPDDILEEVARLIGYENFDFTPPLVVLDKAVRQRTIETERAVREYLAFRAGFQEIFTYPWIDETLIRAAGIDPASCLQLATPPSPETAHLRSSLIPGLLASVSSNLRFYEEMKLFELTQVFRQGEIQPSELAETLPAQPRYLAAALAGQDPVRLFREAKGVLEQMPQVVQITPISFEQQQQPAWADKKVWLNILHQDRVVGSLGLLSARSARLADIKRTSIALFELDMDLLQPLPSRENKYRPLPRFPMVEQDLAIVVDTAVKWQDIEALIDGKVRRCSFIEAYTGKQVPPGKKSILLRVWLGSDEGTLTTEAIDAHMQRIVRTIESKLGGAIRQA